VTDPLFLATFVVSSCVQGQNNFLDGPYALNHPTSLDVTLS